jgi:hypothetical protein
MNSLDVLLYLLCMAGALAGYFLLAPPLSFVVIGLSLPFAPMECACGGQFRQNCSPARRAVVDDGGFCARLAHHWAHRIGQDAMRHQHDYVPTFPEREKLGRSLSRPKRTLLGNPGMILSCCKPALRAKTRFGDHRTPSISLGTRMFPPRRMRKSSWIRRCH